MTNVKTTHSAPGPELSRRDLIMATAATATLAAAGAAMAEPARPQTVQTETAKGLVFETSAQGERGAGVAGVLVSNGREIVRTGPDGGYSLPIEPGMAIFVIKPSGYAVPLEPATRLPRFSYVHQPDGTPAELNFTFSGFPRQARCRIRSILG